MPLRNAQIEVNGFIYTVTKAVKSDILALLDAYEADKVPIKSVETAGPPVTAAKPEHEGKKKKKGK